MSNITKTIAALGVVAGLGVAALPLSSYAAQSNDVTVRANVESNIAVSAADTLVDLGNIISGGPIAEGKTTVTVTTNANKGYTLKIADADNETAMTNLSGGLDKIPAGAPAVGNTAWGVKGGAIDTYTGVTTDGLTLATVANPTTGGADAINSGKTEVTFGVSAGTGLASGTYEDVVVFTAEANS